MPCRAEWDCHTSKRYIGSGSTGYRGELCEGCLWWEGYRLTVEDALRSTKRVDPVPEEGESSYLDTAFISAR